MGDGRLWRRVGAAIGKAVRRHVDHADEAGLVECQAAKLWSKASSGSSSSRSGQTG